MPDTFAVMLSVEGLTSEEAAQRLGARLSNVAHDLSFEHELSTGGKPFEVHWDVEPQDA